MDKKKFKQLSLASLIILLLVFAYFYWQKTDPLETIPVGDISEPPKYVLSMYGDKKYSLEQPLGITVYDNEVFVSDSDAGRVLVFDQNGKLLRIIGEKDKKLRNPYGLAIHAGKLYVADGGLARIAIFTVQGDFKGYWLPKEENRINVPATIYVDDNRIVISDLVRSGIYVFDHQGNLKLAFGGKGTEKGFLNKPHGFVINERGEFIVADSNNNRVQIFDNKGKFIKILGENESNKGEILTPRGITQDEQGNIYVVSGLENRVYVFDKNGKFRFNFNETANGDTLGLPSGIAYSGRKVYVTEYANKRVSVFKY
ncbi:MULTISPECIES: hypothetical protein [unclassified Carboxydocella]|uniref:hypothetical protein n=1 Tax=unclassified Carboxydocella TaxID=2685367 RepID=UPI0009AC56F2|nr:MULTISPECIES: hypothetical protein [unclassified Carboxydocella]AVX30946.1 NHL repeat-containing protein [Carboxydocella thermautotrophica]GAW29660.1 hypothetical protein ULO1_22300 [Carboxydocella sp. ULO1]GAW31448.1 hypothetical protein JDF658_12130 [Carboxydocella sp. JDF658]